MIFDLHTTRRVKLLVSYKNKDNKDGVIWTIFEFI